MDTEDAAAVHGPRVRRIVVASDVHFPDVHWTSWNAFLEFVAHQRPDEVRLNGDIFDLDNLSRFDKNPDPRTGSISEAPGIEVGVAQLNRLAALVPVAYRRGNHEDRWFKSVVQPVREAIHGLEHLIGFEAVLRDLGLDPEIRIVDVDPVEGWKLGQFRIQHGDEEAGGGIHVAWSRMTKDCDTTESICSGHFHRPQLVCRGDRMSVVLGHMQGKAAWAGRVMRTWTRGFGLFELDVDRNWASFYHMLIHDGRFTYGGRVYGGGESVDVVPGRTAGALPMLHPEGDAGVEEGAPEASPPAGPAGDFLVYKNPAPSGQGPWRVIDGPEDLPLAVLARRQGLTAPQASRRLQTLLKRYRGDPTAIPREVFWETMSAPVSERHQAAANARYG